MDLIIRLNSEHPDFSAQLETRLLYLENSDSAVENTVKHIISQIREHGDTALVSLTNQFDKQTVHYASQLTVDNDALKTAFQNLNPTEKSALEIAADRIRQFHIHQKQPSWNAQYRDGTRLGQRITPLERVGIYVPGGLAAYPSSVLMSAIPAAVAGVSEVLMAVPAPHGKLNPIVLAAAHIAGVTQAFTIGGAQAIAALAYGTSTVPQVDKIVGPGNAYVATAKRLVFGQVGIDMVAGPSEIVIISDGSTSAKWAAADLLSQAEHDEDARAILLCPEDSFLDAVNEEIKTILPTMTRQAIIKRSLERYGTLIKVRDLHEAARIVNKLAPEHLELCVGNPESLLEKIDHAGAVFLGPYSSEVLGDYCAGPNHVLPTGRTARFSSPLGVYDFQKRTNIIACSAHAAAELGPIADQLAQSEGLTAHALAARLRCP